MRISCTRLKYKTFCTVSGTPSYALLTEICIHRALCTCLVMRGRHLFSVKNYNSYCSIKHAVVNLKFDYLPNINTSTKVSSPKRLANIFQGVHPNVMIFAGYKL